MRSNCVAYTGTHDNDTTIGWFKELSEEERWKVTSISAKTGDGIHWSLIRAAMNHRPISPIMPMQMLSARARRAHETPSRTDGNWGWRFDLAQVMGSSLPAKLRQIVEMSDRLPQA